MLIIAVAAADGGYLVENGKPDITVRKTSYQTSPDLSPSSNSDPSEAVKQCKKRTKWSKQTDPSLEQKYGSKEMALDVSIRFLSDVLGRELRKGHYTGRGILGKGPFSVVCGRSRTLAETPPRYVKLLPIDKSVCLYYIYRR